MDSHNLNKLNQDVLEIVSWAFKNVTVGWDRCHAVEVRLDDPMTNLLKGGKWMHSPRRWRL